MSDLPIAKFRGQIVEVIRKNPVVIITAKTGAGKSTQVPQYILEAGLSLVVTQPRKLAAMSVAQRVAEERNQALGGKVGYRTAEERLDSKETKCLFCTDGLALVRELMGARKHDVLVIDEVHEWNLNIEVLVAWAKLQLGLGAQFRLVLMSATLEIEALSHYFNGAPVIHAPGRHFPVRDRNRGASLEADAEMLLREGRNVLLFQPGKPEIEKTVDALVARRLQADILPLHGDLTTEEQACCFKQPTRPTCIVATNIAQTSVTVPFIDAVIDSGEEKRIEVVDGIEGLYIRPISMADREQRKGRAGRVKPGEYIDHCNESRPDFPLAEIERSLLDQTVLRLAKVGLDMEELDFFHQPDRREIHQAKRTLRFLGCLNENGDVTEIGNRIAMMPVSVRCGRMLVEAERLQVVQPILTIAAILEGGELTDRKSAAWRKLCEGETTSDVFAQLAIYEAAEEMPVEKLWERGIHGKSFMRARRIRDHLAQSLVGRVNFTSNGKRTDILKAVCAGLVDQLWRGDNRGFYWNDGGFYRKLQELSVVTEAEWIVALPWDLQIRKQSGPPAILHLLRSATKVHPSWLAEIAPHMVDEVPGLSPYFDPERDCVVSHIGIFFNEREVAGLVVEDPEHAEGTRLLARWLVQQQMSDQKHPKVPEQLEAIFVINRDQQRLARELNLRAGRDLLPALDASSWEAAVVTQIKSARHIQELTDLEALILPALHQPAVKRVLRETPSEIELLGQKVPVTYQYDGPPLVELHGEIIADNRWCELPDKGVHLPGGREVAVRLWINGNPTAAETDIRKLKREARILAGQRQKVWEGWQKPDIALPDPSDPLASVPPVEILERSFAEGQEPIRAYGTVAINIRRENSWDPWFTTVWCQTQAEADQLRDEATEKLASLRQAAQNDGVTEELAGQADAMKRRLDALLRECEGRIDSSLYEQLEAYRYALLPDKAARLTIWLGNAERLISQIEVGDLPTPPPPAEPPVVVTRPRREPVRHDPPAPVPQTGIDEHVADLERAASAVTWRLGILREARELIGKPL